MYPVVWVMVPIFMAYYYIRGRHANQAHEILKKALREKDNRRFLVLINEAIRQYMYHGFFFKHNWLLLAISRYWKDNPFPKEASATDALPIDYQACYEYWCNNYLFNLRRQYKNRRSDLVFSAARNLILPIVLFVTFVLAQEGITLLMILSGVATLIMAVLDGFSSYRGYQRLEDEEEVLTDLDKKFSAMVNTDQAAAG